MTFVVVVEIGKERRVSGGGFRGLLSLILGFGFFGVCVFIIWSVYLVVRGVLGKSRWFFKVVF